MAKNDRAAKQEMKDARKALDGLPRRKEEGEKNVSWWRR